MKKIFIVNGAPGSGKTTFEDFCCRAPHVYGAHILSTITFVKEVAEFCGWNGEKTPENRKFLSDLKDLLTKWNDVPFNKVLDELDELNYYGAQYVFIDCREPEEIEKLKQELNATTVLVRRAGHRVEASNHADKNVEDYEYDLYIENDGDLEDLKLKAEEFMEKWR